MLRNIDICEQFSKETLISLKTEIKDSFSKIDLSQDFLSNTCIYACGSLGREEISETSDLDLFFINCSKHEVTNIDKYLFFSNLYSINKKLGFKFPSKNGSYWEFHKKEDLLDIGSRTEDFNNCFTSRLLLLLESKAIYNSELYTDLLKDTINKYFIEYEKYKDNFYPMYLINDILRYWYTLTLNYEFRRDKADKKQVKYWKRLKLKYPRLLTCYTTIACLFEQQISPDYVNKILQETPLKRLDIISNRNNKLKQIVAEIKTEYDWFLSITKYDSTWWDINSNKIVAFKNAERFHDLMVHQLLGEISTTNLELKRKLDF